MVSGEFHNADAATHLSAARLHHMAGELAEAEAAYRAALEINANLTIALFHLSVILVQSRRSADALQLLGRIVATDPTHAEAQYFLGTASANLGKAADAEHWYRACLQLRPQHAEASRALGRLLHLLDRHGEARAHLEAAVALKPGDVNGHLDLGNLYLAMDAPTLASERFHHAARLSPVTSIRAKGSPAFSVVFLWAPGMANTPVHYLIEDAPFDAHFVMAVDPDEAMTHLRGHGDVVFNLLCDVDQCGALLMRSAELLDGLNKPILNPPRKILPTGRDAVADVISHIPGCRTARVVRRTAAELMAFAATQAGGAFSEPILVRQAGTHGGNNFERVDDAQSLRAFVSADDAGPFYVCNYIDYRSADGYFRKYRMIVVRGRGIPYHLAISTHWKIHHFRTDMANQAWMQQEEEAFLRAPENVLSDAHRAALDAVARALDLDFCGIDFAIDRDGALVIFEANAAMLVQPDDSKFAYKSAANARVKAAFVEMVISARRAQ